MKVTELRIEIESVKRGRFKARVNGPSFAKTVKYSVPFDLVEAERETDNLDRLVGEALARQEELRKAESSGANREAIQKAKDARDRAQAELAKAQHRVGARLMQSISRGKLGPYFNKCLGQIEGHEEDRYLRIQLSFDPDNGKVSYLAALPWELMFRQDQGEFVSTSESVAVTRCIDSGQPYRPLLIEGPLRVLVVQSNPSTLRRIDPTSETQTIDNLLGKMKQAEVEVITKENISLLELHNFLSDAKDPIHILHFIGHGGFDASTGEGTLAFVDRSGGDERVTGSKFVDVLKVSDSLRLVVLSTCKGAAFRREKAAFPFIGVAPAALKAGVPAVVAMQSFISDQAAVEFTGGLYSSLAKMEPVEMAVARGRRVVGIQGSVAAEWAAPTLFLRVEKGSELFTREPKDAEIIEPRKTEEPAAGSELVRVGIRSGVQAHERDHSQGLEERTEPFFLDLSSSFGADRVIQNKGGWQTEVYPQLRRFLYETMAKVGNRSVELEMATHASLAFATGYVLEAKSGFDFRIRQSLQTGKAIFFSQEDPQPYGVLWNHDTERPIEDGARDVALAVSVTWPILADVEEYVDKTRLPVARIIPVSVAPEPGQRSVKGGAHAMELAQQLSNIIRQRTREERKGTLHLFVSAPNAVLFFLGQQARGFGKVQLYEHNFQKGVFADYRPSLSLPVVESRSDETENEPKRPFRGYPHRSQTSPEPGEEKKAQKKSTKAGAKGEQQADETPTEPTKPDPARKY